MEMLIIGFRSQCRVAAQVMRGTETASTSQEKVEDECDDERKQGESKMYQVVGIFLNLA
jgi:hypothetical protein